jgi:excisionase family DNA binding protein
MNEQSLSTSKAAGILGVSRQHLATLADSGEIPSWRVGTHRRFNSADLARFKLKRSGKRGGLQPRVGEMNLTDLRSWIYGVLLAAKVAEDPDGLLQRGRINIRKLQEAHPDGSPSPLLRHWEELMNGPTDELLEVLISPSQWAIELRHSSPFAGELSEKERRWVIRSTRNLT